MAKRGATSDLNHDNWNEEEEREEAGTFSKASEETIKKRVIRVAKRRAPASFQHEEEKPNAFGGFSGFDKTDSPKTSDSFGFLSKLTPKETTTKTNGASESDKKSEEYYSKLKGLNESVTEWIKKHVSANPLINLQPVFRDYEKYITDLDKLNTDSGSQKIETSTTSAPLQFSFGTASTTSAPTSKFSFGTTTTSSSTGFSFGTNTTSSFGSNSSSTPEVDVVKKTVPFTFGTTDSSKFSFTSTVIKPADEAKAEDEDEPPKVEIIPVVEDGHIYSIRCKVFVKKDGNFSDHGVGTLYLKPVPDSEKTQLIVRAETNLGRLLCNFILSESIPVKRMGKKDVMLVCIMTPDTKPPPVPILFRVKSPEDADELLNTLEKHKK